MTTKTCKTCQIDKPTTEFSITDKKRGYFFPHCKPCAAAKKRAERQANPEAYNAYQRERAHRDWEATLKYARKANLRAYYKLKDEIFSLLDGCCNRCGYRDWSALHIDHVNGDGGQARAAAGGHTQEYRLIRARLKEGTDDGRYQLLCGNCHCRKSKFEQGGRKVG